MKKAQNWLFFGLLAAALGALFVTQTAAYQSTIIFRGWLLWVVVVDLILLGVMVVAVVVLATQHLVLWRRGDRGARLSLRLTLLFLAMSLFPATALYAVSTAGVFRGIESWFNTPLERAFEKGIEFGRGVLGREAGRLEYVARDIARGLSAGRSGLPFWIDDARVLHQLDGIALYARDGELLVSSGAVVAAGRLPEHIMRQIAEQGAYFDVAGTGAAREIEAVLVLDNTPDAYALKVSRALPPGIADGLEEIERGRREYEKLLVLREGLQRLFILTLTLSFGLILLFSIWLSLRLGRRLTAPLANLSAAAAAVGEGDFTPRLQPRGHIEEIADMNRSFNRMVDNLQESRRQIRRRQEELREANAYLESLLSSLTTGVLTFSADGKLSGHNAAAERLLQLSLLPLVGQTASRLGELPQLSAACAAILRAPTEGAAERRIPGAAGSVLLLRLSPLSPLAGGGMLVMVDDITRQVRAEREATWEEASRRFVHEIKNPLTPVQLAAERLGRKLSGKLSGEDADLLRRLVETIVNQVGAMRRMVDAFRGYATEQRRTTRLVDVNVLLRDLLRLYEGGNIRLRTELADDLPPILGDEVGLRQLLHNLLGNAADALAGHPSPVVLLRTERDGGMLRLIVEDNGGGADADILHKICEPYVTTKEHGTGLGLAIARRTVDKHGGELRIENGAEGLRVVATLPLSAADENGENKNNENGENDAAA